LGKWSPVAFDTAAKVLWSAPACEFDLAGWVDFLLLVAVVTVATAWCAGVCLLLPILFHI